MHSENVDNAALVLGESSIFNMIIIRKPDVPCMLCGVDVLNIEPWKVFPLLQYCHRHALEGLYIKYLAYTKRVDRLYCISESECKAVSYCSEPPGLRKP